VKAKDWSSQASRDLEIAKLSFFDKGYYEWTCYCSQQACEKKLKSVLHELEIGLNRRDFHIHDLSLLSHYIPTRFIKDTAKFENLCLFMRDFPLLKRYPEDFGIGRYPGKTTKEKEAKDTLKIANEIFSVCEEIISSIKTS